MIESSPPSHLWAGAGFAFLLIFLGFLGTAVLRWLALDRLLLRPVSLSLCSVLGRRGVWVLAITLVLTCAFLARGSVLWFAEVREIRSPSLEEISRNYPGILPQKDLVERLEARGYLWARFRVEQSCRSLVENGLAQEFVSLNPSGDFKLAWRAVPILEGSVSPSSLADTWSEADEDAARGDEP